MKVYLKGNNKMQKVFSKSLIAGLLLALAGGSIDAYTYICREGVFASMQTGNLLKLGIGILNGELNIWYIYIIPVIFFSIGVVGSEIIINFSKDKKLTYWKYGCVGAEILVFIAVAFIPGGKFNVVVNSAIALVCAMQYNCFKKLDSLPIATTMCTGNLRSLFENVSKFFITKKGVHAKNAIKYTLLILFFVIGATLMTFAVKLFQFKAVILSAIILLIFLAFYAFSGADEEL